MVRDKKEEIVKMVKERKKVQYKKMYISTQKILLPLG
jgi:hypothetical protein